MYQHFLYMKLLHEIELRELIHILIYCLPKHLIVCMAIHMIKIYIFFNYLRIRFAFMSSPDSNILIFQFFLLKGNFKFGEH
jgi:hypothetical protein